MKIGFGLPAGRSDKKAVVVFLFAAAPLRAYFFTADEYFFGIEKASAEVGCLLLARLLQALTKYMQQCVLIKTGFCFLRELRGKVSAGNA